MLSGNRSWRKGGSRGLDGPKLLNHAGVKAGGLGVFGGRTSGIE